MCHDLCQDPYCLPLSEIAELCPYQVKHILLRPKSDDADEQDFMENRRKGNNDMAGIPDDGSYISIFYKSKLAFGLTRQEVDQLWADYVKENPQPIPGKDPAAQYNPRS